MKEYAFTFALKKNRIKPTGGRKNEH